jgi:hypothetical protein
MDRLLGSQVKVERVSKPAQPIVMNLQVKRWEDSAGVNIVAALWMVYFFFPAMRRLKSSLPVDKLLTVP